MQKLIRESGEQVASSTYGHIPTVSYVNKQTEDLQQALSELKTSAPTYHRAGVAFSLICVIARDKTLSNSYIFYCRKHPILLESNLILTLLTLWLSNFDPPRLVVVRVYHSPIPPLR
jgi:hypothetical protein